MRACWRPRRTRFRPKMAGEAMPLEAVAATPRTAGIATTRTAGGVTCSTVRKVKGRTVMEVTNRTVSGVMTRTSRGGDDSGTEASADAADRNNEWCFDAPCLGLINVPRI